MNQICLQVLELRPLPRDLRISEEYRIALGSGPL